jgi:hypothetical protein
LEGPDKIKDDLFDADFGKKLKTLCYIRDLQVNIIQILSRILGSSPVVTHILGCNMATLVAI